MADSNIHKQTPNRLLEPWFHTMSVVTATDWENFFRLRNHPDAAPAIQQLAEAMEIEYKRSVPVRLGAGEWHTPYVDDKVFWDGRGTPPDSLKQSVARCARVSYKTRDGLPSSLERDVALYDRLITQKPAHASPTEHQATPVGDWTYRLKNPLLNWLTGRDYYIANFNGWVQLRKKIPGENIPQKRWL